MTDSALQATTRTCDSPETIVRSDVFITLQSRRDAEELRRIAEEYCPGAVHEIDLSLHLHDLYLKYGVND